MRDVVLALDGRKVGLCRKVEVHREWQTMEFPIYRDSSATRTIRTLQKIRVIIEKVYQEKEDLFNNLAEPDLSFTLSAGGETHTIAGAKIIYYTLAGGIDGELHEKAILTAETYS
jgi:hypothetical protein